MEQWENESEQWKVRPQKTEIDLNVVTATRTYPKASITTINGGFEMRGVENGRLYKI